MLLTNVKYLTLHPRVILDELCVAQMNKHNAWLIMFKYFIMGETSSVYTTKCHVIVLYTAVTYTVCTLTLV